MLLETFEQHFIFLFQLSLSGVSELMFRRKYPNSSPYPLMLLISPKDGGLQKNNFLHVRG